MGRVGWTPRQSSSTEVPIGLIGLAVLLTVALTLAPLVAETQTAWKVYRIGVLEVVPVAPNAANFAAFRQGLRELGYVEGQNLVIEYRSADGRAERFPDLAGELVRLKVDVIVTRGTPAALAAKHSTGTIPIVWRRVAILSAPASSPAWRIRGGNVTGLSAFATEIQGKQLDGIVLGLPQTNRRSRAQEPPALDVREHRACGGRRAHVLWAELD